MSEINKTSQQSLQRILDKIGVKSANEKKEEVTQENKPDNQLDKKVIKTKSTKITEETIELTDPKAVAEALGLNEKKKKEEEPKEIEEEIDIEAIEIGKKK